MSDFHSLVDNLDDKTKVEDYFKTFFTKTNFKEYQLETQDSDERKAIRIMFESKKDLLERVEDAFEYDPLCVEAFFVYMMMTDDIFLSMRFVSYYKQAENYGEMSVYGKKCFITIMDFYVEFLLDISNVTGAIKVQKMVNRLSSEEDKRSVSRMAFMYHAIEEDEDFYRLYLRSDFDPYCYILLIITLLKHDEEYKAEEVLKDMFDKYEYASYMDHLWDLDYADPEQKEFYDIVEDCFDEISAIPVFFSWCNEIREKYGK